MPRSLGTSVENNFIKGFVTEFSGLNFPENACTDALNVVFDNRGRVSRRRGFDFESGGVVSTLDDATNLVSAFTTYYWANVSGTDRSFVVVQIGPIIHFYSVNTTTGQSSTSKSSYTLNLTSLSTGFGEVFSQKCQFAQGNASLFVAHPSIQPIVVRFDTNTNTFSTSTIDISIRDFKFLNKEITNEVQPATLTDLHKYDMYNQGWSDDTLATYFSGVSKYPSRAELSWYYKEVAPGNIGKKNLYFGSSLGPRGFHILDAFDQTRSDYVPGIGTSYNLSSNGARPSTVAFMAGRVFFSGVPSDKFSNIIYFSKILKEQEDDLIFYQIADPTAETVNELQPSDGGYIIIPEAGNITKLVAIQGAMMVFATNGTWIITGSEGLGFTANDYTVQRASYLPFDSSDSVVIVEGVPIWWTSEGIYTAKISATGANVEIISISSPTIQTYYDSIPKVNKQAAIGCYNSLTKEVIWLYSTDADSPNKYTNILVFRANTQAFYKFKISEDSLVYFRSLVSIQEGDDVHDWSNVKFASVWGLNQFTFSEMRSTAFKDFPSYGSTNWFYDSFFVTGYKARGEGQKKFQSEYVSIVSEASQLSSYFVKALWDYHYDLEQVTKRTIPQQVYIHKTNVSNVTRRLRVRGNGKILQMKFYSDTDKPFTCIGWATTESVNERL